MKPLTRFMRDLEERPQATASGARIQIQRQIQLVSALIIVTLLGTVTVAIFIHMHRDFAARKQAEDKHYGI